MDQTTLIVALAAEAVALAVITGKWRKAVLRRRGEGYGRPWRIRRVPVAAIDPVFVPDPVRGYGPDTEIQFTSRTHHMLGATSNDESWILTVLARRATAMFEFGTCTGRTAYLWALNAPPDASIYTLTLPPDGANDYRHESSDDPNDERVAKGESTRTRFVYSDTFVEAKITQLFGDSKQFDESPYIGRMDLVFVDGSHAYSYVVNDSQKALRMVKPGGIVLWHDYSGNPRVRGCYRALNELANRLPLVHIHGTTLVAFTAPRSAPSTETAPTPS